MKKFSRSGVFSFFLLAAYLLAACGGNLAQTTTLAKAPKVADNAIAFTGTVEAINGDEWTVSGQQFTLDPQASLDPNIALGDRIKVEANVFTDRMVITKAELSATEDAVLDRFAELINMPASLETSPAVGSVSDNANGNSSDGSPNHDAGDDNSNENSFDDGPNHGGNSGSGSSGSGGN